MMTFDIKVHNIFKLADVLLNLPQIHFMAKIWVYAGTIWSKIIWLKLDSFFAKIIHN